MGIGFALAAYAVLSLGLLAFFGVASILTWRSIKPRSAWIRAALVVAPLALAALPPTLFVGGMAWSRAAPPSVQFEHVFDRKPPASVTDLQAKSRGLNDWREVYLAFRAPPAEVHRLTQDAFAPVGEAEATDLVPLPANDDAPLWWRAPTCQVRTVQLAEPFGRWDEVVLTDCRTDGIVYVQALWTD